LHVIPAERMMFVIMRAEKHTMLYGLFAFGSGNAPRGAAIFRL
jgi:hypothetical protein